MKNKLTGLSRRYVAALRRHLKTGLRASWLPTVQMWLPTLGLGPETPEPARIHERAFVALNISDRKTGLTQRARIFFTDAVIPIVQTHRAVVQHQSDLARARRSVRHGAWRRG